MKCGGNMSILVAVGALLCFGRIASSQDIGTGRTWFEAHERAQMARNSREAGEQAGAALAKYADMKLEATKALQAARRAYWDAASAMGGTAPVSSELTKNYLERLRDKDFACLVRVVQNEMRGNGRVGLGDILSGLSGGDVDGGIHPHAQGEFTAWANTLINVTANASVGRGEPDDAEAVQRAYERYLEARNRAEYLFGNHHSPLRSEKPVEVAFAHQLLTKRLAGAQALASVAAMEKVAGRERIVAALAKIRKDLDEVLAKPAVTLNGDYFDWLVFDGGSETRPRAVFLLGRAMGSRWDLADAFVASREKRYGAPKVREAEAGVLANFREYKSLPGGLESREMRYADLVGEALAPNVRPMEKSGFSGQEEFWRTARDVLQQRREAKAWNEGVTRDNLRATAQGLGLSVGEGLTILTTVLGEETALGVQWLIDHDLVGAFRKDDAMFAISDASRYAKVLEAAYGEEPRVHAVRILMHRALLRGEVAMDGNWDTMPQKQLVKALAGYRALVAKHGEPAVLARAQQLPESSWPFEGTGAELGAIFGE